ncbi:MAG TPA: acyltransferase [Gordonia polyisoprenivorans]|uniref:Acyltransferase n=1 Tax=Gordonia polyisoprenivorans TaxID=84595 RepID=A0A846WH38_9ACTN|nr:MULTISPECIES: acyltransferase [Gordonia]MDF3284049.1 acyltransferase [Gordonia sp. N1V]NKY00376.1 acyltransferase [Gordonia polyisoprenivorans]OPX14911.1 acetyltransferase [Gordonia sp. i37]OZC34015.1 acetyltransferase [Gordonia polyisoprenivorans]QUD81734.1 acyltransferase [Gordonia polyisoprenivorans]
MSDNETVAAPASVTVPERDDFTPRYSFNDISTIAKARNRVGILLYNNLITFIPSHTIRQAFLRLFGAKIGKDTSILRGCQVFDIDQIRIGEACSIGFRVLFDARSGICIGDNVVIASDTQIIAGKHDPASPEFVPVIEPVYIGDYVWIASRATIVSGVSIGRGAVVAACAMVGKDVADLDIVGGVPARVISKRPETALRYRPKYRPLFY